MLLLLLLRPGVHADAAMPHLQSYVAPTHMLLLQPYAAQGGCGVVVCSSRIFSGPCSRTTPIDRPLTVSRILCGGTPKKEVASSEHDAVVFPAGQLALIPATRLEVDVKCMFRFVHILIYYILHVSFAQTKTQGSKPAR